MSSSPASASSHFSYSTVNSPSSSSSALLALLFWLFTSSALLLLLPPTPPVLAIKWLALHRVQPPWHESGNCPQTREERKVHGLVTYQARICTRLPELIPHIISAATLTVDVCQWAFGNRRWNCSSVQNAPNLSAELTTGTKEQAYVYALSSAAVTHQVAKACSSGQLSNCPCGYGDTVTTTSVDPGSLMQQNLTQLGYKWKGCSDNVIHGRRISREWSDAKWRPNAVEAVSEIATKNKWNIVEPDGGQMRRMLKLKRHSPEGKTGRNGQKARMNEFNNEIGREITEQLLYKKCKCHGVSSSCDVKTCWYTLPPLEQIAQILKEKYDLARPMLLNNNQNRQNSNNNIGNDGIAIVANGGDSNSISESTALTTLTSNTRRRWKSLEDISTGAGSYEEDDDDEEEEDDPQALVYLRNSPNYCEENPAMGSQGTRHRECNISSYGTDSCESLCCGRGYTVAQIRLEENCQCKYVHCCYIKCKKCTTTLNKYFCK